MKVREPKQLWKTALAQIEIKLDAPAQFKTFFADTELIGIEGKKAIIGVQNPYTADWLKQRHEGLIKETITYVYGDKLTPEFKVHNKKGQEPVIDNESEDSPLLSAQNGIMGNVIDVINKSGLNTTYSLSNFIIGNANRIAHAASLAVIDKPGEVYNPLFIYGKTGVGKTHLAQAIGRAVLERNIRKKVIYTSSENFLNEMVKGLKTASMEKFRAKYRQVDILIIDDMQLISKWVQTQDEFFNTFNQLHIGGSQVIMIADRKPEDIKNLESRLRSRMQGGMVADISKPDYEMRLAIVEKKAITFGIDLNHKILEYIARSVTDNVRELEGALKKISLFNQMKPNGDLTLEEVSHMLGKDTKSKREKIKIPKVLKEVSKSFGVKVADLKGPRRTKEVALARQVAMYILREEFDYKLEEVAHTLNRKDHTTVIHAIDKIQSKMMLQEEFNMQVGNVITSINDSAVVTDDID
ncbi:MAG: chromosomal replication initiator protein DnaA [Candidatus Dojkabacteria bacterium]|nr:chromosomal replication initiator protein DnaA [Candidatus Dojkabacteria bacterium]